MATKMIRMDQETYDPLKAARREGESLSEVVEGAVRRPLDTRQPLRRIGEQPISPLAVSPPPAIRFQKGPPGMTA